jgi:hypothetical protein
VLSIEALTGNWPCNAGFSLSGALEWLQNGSLVLGVNNLLRTENRHVKFQLLAIEVMLTSPVSV